MAATAKAGEQPEASKQGLHEAAPRKNIVDDYPERPYSEAVTKEWRAHLEENGIRVEDAAVVSGDAQ